MHRLLSGWLCIHYCAVLLHTRRGITACSLRTCYSSPSASRWSRLSTITVYNVTIRWFFTRPVFYCSFLAFILLILTELLTCLLRKLLWGFLLTKFTSPCNSSFFYIWCFLVRVRLLDIVTIENSMIAAIILHILINLSTRKPITIWLRTRTILLFCYFRFIQQLLSLCLDRYNVQITSFARWPPGFRSKLILWFSNWIFRLESLISEDHLGHHWNWAIISAGLTTELWVLQKCRELLFDPLCVFGFWNCLK